MGSRLQTLFIKSCKKRLNVKTLDLSLYNIVMILVIFSLDKKSKDIAKKNKEIICALLLNLSYTSFHLPYV